MMGFNFGTEYFALNGETPLTELPTVKSMLKRIGVDDVYLSRYPHLMDWRPFLTGQISRIGGLSIPYFLLQLFGYEYTPHYRTTLFLLGAVVFAVGLLGLFFVRYKILTATALLSGWCWAAPVRGSAATHDFEVLFHIGIPLVFFALVSLPIRRLSGDRLIEGLAIVAGLVFVLSSIPMARVGLDAEAPEHYEHYVTLTADFERIRAIVQPGRSVFVAMRIDGGVGLWARSESLTLVKYYLAGRIFARDRSAYDFLISDQRIDGPALLTPENGQVFLYHGIEYSTLIDEMIARSELVFRSDFDVYRSGNSLIYTRERCWGDDDAGWFFLHVFPVDVNDLPDHRKPYRFNALDFHFDEYRIPFIDRCVAVRDLPDYDIASVRTGQYTEEGQLWEAEFGAEVSERHATLTADFERIRAIVQPGRSVLVAIRSGGAGQWSNDDSMTLVNDYLAGRNLTRDRSAYDFLISDQRIDGPALLTPENGQVFLYDSTEYSTLIDEMIARSELISRSDFDVYRSGNSLIYTRERCRGDDDAGWFFLHIVPVDMNDLPAHRKQYGFDNLDFRLDEYRIPFIDRCVAMRDLPDYDIAGVRTGQSTEEGQQLWKAEFGAEVSERHATLTADFERIRAIVQPGRSVFVALRAGGAGQWSNDDSMTLVNDYLAGRNLTRDRSAYDFLISDQRIDGPALLTPENGQVFLYDSTEYSTLIDEMIAKSELVFRSDFDVYRSGNSLIYTRERCWDDDDAGWFFLHIVPVDVNDLPDHRKQYGFDHLDFRFDKYRIPFIDRCVAVRDLPAYDIAGVRTGQSTEEGQQLWKAEFGFAP